MLDPDELPAELSEQAYMWQREQGVGGGDDRRQEWLCSGRRPDADGEQQGTVDWMGQPWEQKGAEEDFVEGVEQQLLGEGHSSMRRGQKWQSRLAQAVEGGDMVGTGECWMCIMMEVPMEQARQQPRQSMASWLGALMRTHWRSGLREQREWEDSLRRWTPLHVELSCWVPMQSCVR